MTFDEFQRSLANPEPPAGTGRLLQALWYDAREDWERAHDIAQEANTAGHCLLHAYLHRKEGDQWNANYWYQRAGESTPGVSLEEEWKLLVNRFLPIY